ncbi:MAG: hypothetical protein NTU61_05425 [Candidatus Altiarchaeota archaeon]|nr:hypothetical protein [Candidatus Altiarchaeota archaeon]
MGLPVTKKEVQDMLINFQEYVALRYKNVRKSDMELKPKGAIAGEHFAVWFSSGKPVKVEYYNPNGITLEDGVYKTAVLERDDFSTQGAFHLK